MLGSPPPPVEPGNQPADPLTPKVWVNQGGEPPLPPTTSKMVPKWLHTPWGHTLARSSPRGTNVLPKRMA